MRKLLPLIVLLLLATGCMEDSQTAKTTQAVQKQQSQYAIGQPVPVFDWSLERSLLIQLYELRNRRVATHSVWRSDLGTIEGDCPSIGFGLPYDTSLTNPWMSTNEDQSGHRRASLTSIGQPEPNGIYASQNTSATWIMCVGDAGTTEPHYVETKVTVYPGPVDVDYTTNRVVRSGKASVLLTIDRQ